MSYLVLARKWRPQTFEQIRGQEHVVRALRNAIGSERIAHAYLFTGIRGVGKTSAARVLSKALNCAQGPTPTPCGQCPSCHEIPAGKSADVLEIDGASNTGVDDVRRLREAVRYPPVRDRHRIYIIDEVHMLSTAAFNALLKTLEEPPPQVVFIFATTDPHKIPATILSRCQQFDFKRLSPKELMGLLRDVAQAEEIRLDERSLAALAREAEGSVRDAQSLLDQVISYAGSEVRYDDVRDVLGVVDRDLLLRVAGAVLERDPRVLMLTLGEAERFGYDPRRFAYDLLDAFRDLAVLKAVAGGEDLVELAADEVQALASQLEGCSWEDVHARYDMLSRGVETLRGAPRPEAVLEMTLLKMAQLPPLVSLSGVVAEARRADAELPPPAAPGGAPPTAPSEAAPVSRPAPPPPPEPPAEAVEATEDAAPAPSQQAAPAPSQQVAPAPSQQPAPATDDQAAPSPVSAQDLWSGLLAGLRDSNRPLWSVLREHARLASWDAAAGLAVVAYDDPSSGFFLTAKLDLLTRALRGATGGGGKVELRCAATREPVLDREQETDRSRQLRRAAVEDPLVRSALDIFDADVEEVRLLK